MISGMEGSVPVRSLALPATLITGDHYSRHITCGSLMPDDWGHIAGTFWRPAFAKPQMMGWVALGDLWLRPRKAGTYNGSQAKRLVAVPLLVCHNLQVAGFGAFCTGFCRTYAAPDPWVASESVIQTNKVGRGVSNHGYFSAIGPFWSLPCFLLLGWGLGCVALMAIRAWFIFMMFTSTPVDAILGTTMGPIPASWTLTALALFIWMR